MASSAASSTTTCSSGPRPPVPTSAGASASRASRRGPRPSPALPADMPIEPFKGHAYVVRRRAPRRLGGLRFMLVGDAAGLARDLSGEGIGPAIRSGILAAGAAEAFVRTGAPLDGYAARITSLYGPGEPGWIGRRLARLPETAARPAGRPALRFGPARRATAFYA